MPRIDFPESVSLKDAVKKMTTEQIMEMMRKMRSERAEKAPARAPRERVAKSPSGKPRGRVLIELDDDGNEITNSE